MPASRMRALARTSRCPIAAGATRNAEAIRAASRPSTVCSIKGARAAGSINGWAQTNMSCSRSSGRPAGSRSCRSSARRVRAGSAAARTARWRPVWISCRRAAVNSQASGRSGTPFSGQTRKAAAKASARASSAAATSRLRADR